MADNLGTWNYIEFASEPKYIEFTSIDASGDEALPDIVVPAITGATIQRAILEFRVITSQAADNQWAGTAQYIQIKESVSGSYTNAVNVVYYDQDHAGFSSIVGSYDITSEVSAFNKTYNIKWTDAHPSLASLVELSAQTILKVWYTIDSGVEAKVDTIDGIVDDIKGAIIADAGAVVADGGTLVNYFKTDLTSTTLNYWANLQVMFLTGNNAGIAKRISAYSTAKFITVAESFPSLPVAADTFVIIGRVAGAGSALTEASIADAVWDELKAGHTASTSFGKILQDVETDVDAVLVDTNEIQGKLPTNYIMGSAVVSGKDDEIDAILADTGEMQPYVASIYGKLPSSAYLKGTADSDGGMDTADKADVNAQADLALADYDPPTFTEMDTFETNITAEVDANEAKLDIVTTMVAQIQNNVFFSTTVLDMYQRPAAGSVTYRVRAMVFDGTGTPEDPDTDQLYMTLDGTSGSIIARTLMTKQGVGIYYYDVVIASTDTLEDWTFTFDYLEVAVTKTHYRQSALTEWSSDINDIQTKITAVHVKVDAIAPSPTIPAQLSTHDTDVKALQRIEACPDLMYVPAGRTQINLEGGITAIATTIPVTLSDNLISAGIVKIESEYIIYTGVSGGSLTGCTRGAYSTVAAIHADATPVSQTLMFPILLVVKDNEGNMLAPDSAPTVEIDDWNGTQELAPTAMTLVSTGIYRYNYMIDYGDLAENIILTFTTVIATITAYKKHEVVVIDQPASNLDLVQYLGGGSGDYILDQDGWYDTDGVKTAWTDVAVGYVRDADTGAPLDDAWVTAYPIIDGETMYSGRPTAQARTRANGTWVMALDAETYTFVIEKDGFRIAGDGVVERTVG